MTMKPPAKCPSSLPDDIKGWYANNGGAPQSKLGWRGVNDNNTPLELSELVWKNPHPDKTIRSIDFISTLKAAAPFVVGITLE